MKKIYLFATFVLFWSMPVWMAAAVTPKRLKPAPTPLPGIPIKLQKIIDATADVSQFLLFVGTLVAVIFIVIGGIKWMSAGANATKAGEARQTILNGLIGAIIVLGMGTLLATAVYIFNGISTGTL